MFNLIIYGVISFWKIIFGFLIFTRIFTEKRWDKIQETYEEVCRFMRYYHGLAKKTERD